MTVKPKTYVAHLVMVSPEWGKAVGATHHRQIDLLAVAYSKAELTAMLTDRGLAQWEADRLTTEFRMIRGDRGPNSLGLLVDAGILDREQAQVLMWHNGVKDDPIIRVAPDGTLTTVGHFRYETGRDGRGLYAEKG